MRACSLLNLLASLHAHSALDEHEGGFNSMSSLFRWFREMHRAWRLSRMVRHSHQYETRHGPYERLTPSPQAVERVTGLKVCIRGVRWDNPRIKGRLRHIGDILYVEFRDDNPGYFWHFDTVRKLLELAILGFRYAELYDEPISLPRHCGPKD